MPAALKKTRPVCPRKPHLPRGICLFSIIVVLFVAKQQSASQTLPPGTFVPLQNKGNQAYSKKNSLGAIFVEVPGTPLMFSVWETRVSDYETFLLESGYAWNHKPHFPQTGDHPVVNVTLQDAIAFCDWLTRRERTAGLINNLQSYRLPTNNEWDTAVGLISGRKEDLAVTQKVLDQQSFPWGIEWPPPARSGNFNSLEISGADDGYTFTAPVGIFSASKDGLYDLGGNVWEWTWDQEVSADTYGTLRGGSWMYFRKECLLSAYQYRVPGDLRSPSIGFRCVFEDKHRSAVFFAAADQSAIQDQKQRRDLLTTAPTVTADEVREMRERMANKPKVAATNPITSDPSKLPPAKAGQSYRNILDMKFQPLQETTLIGEHEVRIQDYMAYLSDAGKAWNQKPSFAYQPSHPVMNVSWNDADAFCEWLTAKERAAKLIGASSRYRLPSDAEWSIAAGLKDEAGDTPDQRHLSNRTDYPWGKEWPPPSISANLDTANINGYQDNYSHTSPVGSFSPNGLHLFDLSGNVAEWCSDVWPPESGEHVLRGGSWLTSKQEALLSSYRSHLSQSGLRSDVGFRVVLELDAP
ncbi:MAG: hypothetical protein RL693_1927 [Verrucomicrobiota bacterium]